MNAPQFVSLHDAELSGFVFGAGSELTLSLDHVDVYVEAAVEPGRSHPRYQVSSWTVEIALGQVVRIELDGPLEPWDHLSNDVLLDQRGAVVRCEECIGGRAIASVRCEFVSGAKLVVEAGSASLRLVRELRKLPDWEGPLTSDR